jgi:hypothetical protein
MSTTHASRAPSGPSLADVLTCVTGAANLSKTQRQNMESAVRTVARALDRPLESIPADPALLARRLDGVAPLAMCMTKGSWSNVRSRLKAAFALARPMLPGRSVQPLSAHWQPLYDALPENRGFRLSRLLRHLSTRGIEPGSVAKECQFALNRSHRPWRYR